MGTLNIEPQDRPGRPSISVVNQDGEAQTIDFLTIANVPAGTAILSLRATASSKLPVQFYAVSGPVELKDDNTLEFLPIPPQSKFPVRVVIGAYQFGRRTGHKVQSAPPVLQEFWIQAAGRSAG